MLSIGKLGVAGGANYYLDKVANSVDDYYLGRGEAPGQWVGQAATELGLTGQVSPGALRNLLAGKSAGGEALGLQVQPGRRPGCTWRPRASPPADFPARRFRRAPGLTCPVSPNSVAACPTHCPGASPRPR